MKKLIDAIRRMKIFELFKKGSYDKSLIFAVIIGLFVISNILVQNISLKADFSKGAAYTLSPATKKVLKSLDDIVSINFYLSTDVPTKLIPLKTEVIDLLGEFNKENKSKIKIKISDPKKDTTAQKEVESLGIPELQFSQLEKDKYQLSSAYFGLSVSYGDKKEGLPQATDLGNLEYNITSLIYRLTKKELEKVAIVGALSESPNTQDDPYIVLKKVLATQYELSDLDISDEEMEEISPQYSSVILIASNVSQYTQRQIKLIKEYVSKGGKLVVMADGVNVQDDLTTQKATHNLFEMLKGWGITLQTDLILSTSAEFVNFGNTSYQFFTPYPFWLKTNAFEKTSGYFANVSTLTFPWTSSVSIDKNSSVIVSSPEQSWSQAKDYNLYPQNIQEPSKQSLKQYPLIVQTKPLKNKGSVTLIPSSRFLDARYLSRTTGNLEFIFNLMNGLVSKGSLSGIRSRSLNIYPLPVMSDMHKEAVKYLNIFLLPVLFAAFGAFRLLRRK